jgi:hypothetical protein
MEKLDKVIAGLECCQNEDSPCDKNCPYFKGYVLDDCTDRLRDDALEVLKEYRGCLTGCGIRQYGMMEVADG